MEDRDNCENPYAAPQSDDHHRQRRLRDAAFFVCGCTIGVSIIGGLWALAYGNWDLAIVQMSCASLGFSGIVLAAQSS